MSRTAVVILNWNGVDFLKMFLGIAVKFTSGTETDIFVADNGSDDGSSIWIEENYKDVKLIRFDKNHGFAGGYNLALDRIEAKYFVLLNSDVEVTEGWLQPIIDFMEDNPDVASCQPKILSYLQKDHFEYAGAAGGFIDKFGYPYCRGRIFDNIELDKGQYDDQVDIFWSSGACMAVREEAWRICGGFDASFFAHMEEIDLCWRFNRKGYKVSYIPSSVVYHVGGGVLPYDSPLKTYLNFRNSLFMLYKNLPDNKLYRILIIRKLLDGVAALLFLIKGRMDSFKSVWNAHIDYYKNIDALKTERKKIKKPDSGKYLALVLNKSIVFEFYAKGRKTYNSLR